MLYRPQITPLQRQAQINRQAMQQSERQAANALAASKQKLIESQQPTIRIVYSQDHNAHVLTWKRFYDMGGNMKVLEAQAANADNLRRLQGRDFIKRYAEEHGVTFEAIRSPSRIREITTVRQNCIYDYWAHIQGSASLPEIGRLFRRDHTTILATLRKIGKERGTHYLECYRPDEPERQEIGALIKDAYARACMIEYHEGLDFNIYILQLCAAVDLTVAEFESQDGGAQVTKKRHVVIYRLRETTGLSLMKLGLLVNKESGAVSYAIKKTRDLLNDL